eukprot:2936047-Karenia_brevis.AAC.1
MRYTYCVPSTQELSIPEEFINTRMAWDDPDKFSPSESRCHPEGEPLITRSSRGQWERNPRAKDYFEG